ncbi:hypothetical protein TBLA_0I03110 [Henningerozyma blattae CBS 6284]|uniref:Ribose-phosphate pyrophosphokinase 1 n=1 Tax=Henningerozyma blattae (strain ATCC 34711 / CBS 6284 / DSM 70876 / NBRC 10599 / NRRL Y-10934 / UCD 77-7) TaxID=1071380 RepID=I2H9B4_HENB6|nr:hypothetical protein TBLA_0I03110 [Tetrapisispora blattae CBS 6284]CCH62966.1 hypothetical protein TBLA_0I03110 [Tetrapisispora blattae CBS 6284]
MRKCKVFVGNSHPELGYLICKRLGIEPAPCTLQNFANGETSVQIGSSVRDEDVYVIQSASSSVNDHIMELLILVSACRGGSAKKITAVIPQFPYSKQCRMKKHRGAITARMLANLVIMAGADHVISMDLHSNQMQGFFSKPVDNLYGGPCLAQWITENIKDYQDAVIVSKNPGGAKRVTALASTLRVNFAMIHTDRRRAKDIYSQNKSYEQLKRRKQSMLRKNRPIIRPGEDPNEQEKIFLTEGIQTARIRNGHVIDDNVAESDSDSSLSECSPETSSSNPTQDAYALGETYDGYDSEDDEPTLNQQHERLITLVGNVRNRIAIILDDMIDRPGAYISAAEHLVQNCGATKVYIIGIHGIFTGDCLEQLEQSDAIHQVVVTNTFPISKETLTESKKLVVIDVSMIFAECIRRNHNGESISVLFDSITNVV